MSRIENSRSGKELSLWDWLGSTMIKIPMMQRDYAQGRKGMHYLRERFLKSLFDTLLSDQQRVKLDFVYGKEENLNVDSNLLLVTPIDGQQRLTSLWLIHWYVAMRSGNINEEVVSRLLRFTYDTRLSSRDFCKNIVKNGEKIQKLMSKAQIGVVESIRRQTWYRNSWDYDPTVIGMLTTLSGDSHAPASCKDGIEKCCKGISDKRFVDIWNRLVSKPSECPISFYFQSLDGIGDADGLYVKMNARGKSLTAFENFKAELSDFAAEQVRRGVDVTIWTDVPTKLDTEWSDIFWMAPEEDDVGQVSADDRYLAFIRRLVFDDIVTESINGEYQVGNDVKGFSEDLRDSTDFYHFFEGRCVYDSFDRYSKAFSRFYRIKSVLNYFNDNSSKADDVSNLIKTCTPSWFLQSQSSWLNRLSFIPTSNDFLKDGSYWKDSITQPGRVWFLAIARFFEAPPVNEEERKKALVNWLRVVANIIENADINTMGSMISTMRLINELSSHSTDIINFLADNNYKIESSASAEQIKEEREKAYRILNNPNDEKCITDAEGELFNKGMIRYLYRKNETLDWDCFGVRRENMKKLFSDNGSARVGTVPRFAAGFQKDGFSNGVYKSIAFIPGDSQRSAASWKRIFRDMHDKNRGGICRQQLENFIDDADKKVDDTNLDKVILLLVKALDSMEHEGSGLQTLVTRVLTNWTAKVGTSAEVTYNYVLTDYANRQARPNNGLFIDLCGSEEDMKSEIERYGRYRGGGEHANNNNDDNQNSKNLLQKREIKNSTNYDENNRNDIEIVLDPSDPVKFKSELLRTRRASRTREYADNRTPEVDEWRANSFTENSDLMGNIKTSTAYRYARRDGVVRLLFKIKDSTNRLNDSTKSDDAKVFVSAEGDQNIVRSDNHEESLNSNNLASQTQNIIRDEANDNLELKSENENECISKEFIREVMSIPSCSKKEGMMKKYIREFAKKRGIDIDEDEKGNLYLTKGHPTKDGGYYPCIVNHMDTVQQFHKQYVESEVLLTVSERINEKEQIELYVKGTGIGADDKLGCAIALALIAKLPVVKLAFFVEEELDMAGSKCLSVEWFKDVGFCLSFDSPERNRTSKICGGERLFSDEFFENVLKPICGRHGITEFRNEPDTDVVQIRKKTSIMCYNVGNGGYNAHDPDEYLIVEDAQAAYKFGLDLLSNIGENRYWFNDN